MTDRFERRQADFVDEMLDRWRPGAMFPSEVAWLGRGVRGVGADIVIECGRQDGFSTWMLASLLQGSGTHILSIDFDEDPEKLRIAREQLVGLDATCISGDIHVEVPKLLQEHPGATVAVVQDGPKGWEGLATLLAAAFEPNVALVAQHNLDQGHVTRTVFQMLAGRPCFLETAAADDPELYALRTREMADLPARAPNRPIDHTSLGLIPLDEPGREHLISSVRILRRRMAPWDPLLVRQHWDRGDYAYCSRLRARARFTRARFKKR